MKHGIAIAVIVALLIWRFTSNGVNVEGEYPSMPIQVVVPYPQGGGSDNFARLIGQAVAEEKLLDEPMVVLNQPGGSGTIGSRYVKDARPDGYRLLCHHESIVTAELSGAVTFGPDDFEVIAQTGNIVLMILVREDSPYETVADLLKAAKEKPKTIRFGANTGSPAHFTAMKLEAAEPGAEFNLVTAGGGQTRYISLIGGHLEAGVFSLAEYISFLSPEGTPPDKNIRALAVLSDTRHPDLPEVQTCVEQGIDVTSSNAYYWWAPLGTPSEVIEKLAITFEKAMQNEAVRAQLATWSIGLEFTKGDALKERLEERIATLKPPGEQTRLELPNFPLIVMVAVGLLAIFVVVSSLRNPCRSETSGSRDVLTGVFCLGAFVGYIVLLQIGDLSFALVTGVMVFLMGNFICRWERSKLPVLVEIAFLAGLGSEFVFTRIFMVALP